MAERFDCIERLEVTGSWEEEPAGAGACMYGGGKRTRHFADDVVIITHCDWHEAYEQRFDLRQMK
jgi:hypothetical protein